MPGNNVSNFTMLVPTQDQILGQQIENPLGKSIEESIGKDTILDTKVLEALATKVLINSIEVEGNIFEGLDPNTMNKGFWHFPHLISWSERKYRYHWASICQATSE